MSASDDFFVLAENTGVPVYQPLQGLAVELFRSGSTTNNSGLRVLKYDGSITRTTLAQHFVPFQFESGETFEVTFTINNDYSTITEISNGVTTDTFTTSPTVFTASLDQFFITDTQGGFGGSFMTGEFILRFDDVLVTQPTLEVSIDIKPGSNPNSINLGSGGATPVAVLGSTNFDVDDIDPETLTLGTAGVKTVGKKNNLLCSFDDVSGDFSLSLEGDPDGYLDLICHFTTMSIVPEEGGTTATINGELFDGTAIKGTDSVNIVP